MHYLLLPFTVGSIHRGFSTGHLHFVVQNIEDFKARLFCAMDAHVQKINQNQNDYSEFSFDGQAFPEQGLFFYDSVNDMWSCHKPELVELMAKDNLECFVVEAAIGTQRSYLPPCYKIMWAENKSEVETELKKAYEVLSLDKEIRSYSILGEDFKADEIVGYEYHYGEEPKLKPFNALGRVFSLEEFFSRKATL